MGLAPGIGPFRTPRMRLGVEFEMEPGPILSWCQSLALVSLLAQLVPLGPIRGLPPFDLLIDTTYFVRLLDYKDTP